MVAYVISDVTPLDEVLIEEYREHAARSIELYGGRYLVRGALPHAAEGTWPAAARSVIVEFPSMARVHEWYGSPEYARALAVRPRALERRLLFVEGTADLS